MKISLPLGWLIGYASLVLWATLLTDGWRFLERIGWLPRFRAVWNLRRKRWDLAERGATHALRLSRMLPRYRGGCHLVRAWSMANRGSLQTALNDCEMALELRPNYGPALFLKGALLCDLGHFEQAIEPLRRSAELNPRSPDISLTRAVAARRLGLMLECEESLSHCLELNNTEARARRMRAEIFAEKGRYQEALSDYCQLPPTHASRSLPLSPRLQAPRLELAMHLVSQGQNAEAAFWAERHLLEKANDPVGHITLALALTELNQHEDALASCDAALRESLSAYALWLRGANSWVLGDIAGAERDLEFAAALDQGRNPAVSEIWRDFRVQTGASPALGSHKIAFN